MTKFKVGDKVRILDASKIIGGQSHWSDGDITEVTKVDEVFEEKKVHLRRVKADVSVYCPFLHEDELRYIELVSDKPTKNQRITTLESEVAELKAKVEALENAQTPTQTVTQNITVKSDADITKVASQLAKLIECERVVPARRKSPNEQRKAIITEAKAFVEDAKNFTGNCSGRKGYKYASTNNIVCDVEFHVNAEKRTVVALLKYQYGGYVAVKGIAKCAPDDVFNANIGKAIALGRALGLDVSRFEQAVKPNVAVVGMKAEVRGNFDNYVNTIKDGLGFCHSLEAVTREDKNRLIAILDDTEAQY